MINIRIFARGKDKTPGASYTMTVTLSSQVQQLAQQVATATTTATTTADALAQLDARVAGIEQREAQANTANTQQLARVQRLSAQVNEVQTQVNDMASVTTYDSGDWGVYTWNVSAGSCGHSVTLSDSYPSRVTLINTGAGTLEVVAPITYATGVKADGITLSPDAERVCVTLLRVADVGRWYVIG